MRPDGSGYSPHRPGHRGGYRLRPLDERDLDRVLAWRNSDRIRENMYTDHVITPEEHREWFRKVEPGGKDVYLVFEHHGRPLGMVYFTDIDRKNGNSHWGFYLGEKGLPPGTGSVMGVLGLEYAFGFLNIRKLYGEAFVFNAASIRFFLRLGFVQEGRLSKHVLKGGRFEDVVVFGLLREDWEKNREALERSIPTPSAG